MKCFKGFAHTAFAALLVAAFAAAASAQTAKISGKVTLKQADGTSVPVKDASIKIVRVDINQDMGTLKTDKNGGYVKIGLPLAGSYVLLVSAPGAAPAFDMGARPGRTGGEYVSDFELHPGDGRAITIDEAKAAAAAGGRPAPGATAADVENAKKKAAEMAAEIERVKKENEKAAEYNAKIPEILKAGNEAYNAKNYDVALAKYDEGIAAAPEEHVFYVNKAVLLLGRATDKYNTAHNAKDNAGKEAARAQLKMAVDSAEKGVAVYRAKQAKGQGAAPAAAAAAAGPQKSNEELFALGARADGYRLAFLTYTPIDSEAAAKAIEEYVNVETDAGKKNKMQAVLGEALLMSNKVDESIAKFRQILSANPNNVDAMRGLGISLAAKANEDPSALPEAVKMMEQFVEKAPPDHKQRPEVLAMAEELRGSIKELSNKPQAQDKGRPARKRP